MLFLPCSECGRTIVARQRVDRDTVRCKPCTRAILNPPEAKSHDDRIKTYSKRMEIVMELCQDEGVDISKASTRVVDKIVEKT